MGRPASVRASAIRRLPIGSLFTSTPSQSKMMRSQSMDPSYPSGGGPGGPLLGHGLLCGRARQRDDRCQPRHAAPPGHPGRLLDLLDPGPVRLRRIRRRQQHRRRSPLHRPLDPGPGRGGLSEIRYPDDGQGGDCSGPRPQGSARPPSSPRQGGAKHRQYATRPCWKRITPKLPSWAPPFARATVALSSLVTSHPPIAPFHRIRQTSPSPDASASTLQHGAKSCPS